MTYSNATSPRGTEIQFRDWREREKERERERERERGREGAFDICLPSLCWD